jgi:hypothetical protein
LYTIQEHGLEINIGLVHGYRLEFQLHTAVLNAYPAVNLLQERYFEIEARPQDTAVFAKHGYHCYKTLVYGYQPAKDEQGNKNPNSIGKDEVHKGVIFLRGES